MATPRILIAEDFLLIRTLLKNVLSELDQTQVEEAKDGLEAYEKIAKAYIEKKPFNIVFIDWNMPRMTGIEVVEKCLAQAELKTMQFVMITAEREQDKVKRALQAGVKDFIVKPFSTATIKEKVSKIIESQPMKKPA
jgi:two-component system, chemotaxis family, chemotaxis protein CheY